VAGIQARMGSRRLPGKSLASVAGRPLVAHIVERVRAASSVEQCVVLTSREASDDPLAAFCEQEGITVRRGPLEDVLARYLDLIHEFDPRFVVRVTGDAALVDPSFIDQQVQALARHEGDWIQVLGGDPGEFDGVLGGQGVVSARALLDAQHSQDARDREHAGSFHRAAHAYLYRIVGLVVDERYRRRHLRLCVDEAADLALVRHVYEHFAPRHGSCFPLSDVLAYLDTRREVAALNVGVVESDANREHRGLVDANPTHLVGRWP
jgi:spore coat polysaccharide biosynthesis protein SpsF